MATIEKATLNKSKFYAEHLKKWQQSKISQEKYCKLVNISYPAFIYWRAKFSKDQKSSVEEKRNFLPVQPAITKTVIQTIAPKSKCPQITVNLTNGIQLLFPLSLSSTVIIDCIKTIEEAYANSGC